MTQNKTQNQKHKKTVIPEPTGNKDISQFLPQLKQIEQEVTGHVFVTLTDVILKPNSTIYIHAPDGKLICKVNTSRGITARDDIPVDRDSNYGYRKHNCFNNKGKIIFPSQR